MSMSICIYITCSLKTMLVVLSNNGESEREVRILRKKPMGLQLAPKANCECKKTPKKNHTIRVALFTRSNQS